MKERPFAAIGITFLVSQAVAVFLGFEISLILASVGIMLILLCVFVRKMKITDTAVILLAAAVVSLSYTSLRYRHDFVPAEMLGGQKARIEGIVYDHSQAEQGRNYYFIDTEKINIDAVPQKIRIRLSTKLPLEADIGDRIKADVVFNRRSSIEKGMQIRLISQKTAATAYLDDKEEVYSSDGEKSLYRFFVMMRRGLSARTEEILPETEAGIANAMLFGDKSGLDYETVSRFRICGLSHLFAVSGLHLTIITSALSMLLKKLGVKRMPEKIILIVSVVFFAALTGFGYSVIRAGIMLIFKFVADIIYRDSDSLTSLGFAAVVICLASPYSAADVGLELSFLATLGILLLYPRLYKRGFKYVKRVKNGTAAKILKYILGLVCVTVSATLAVLPVSALYFGEISLVNIPASVLCSVPSTGFLLSSALMLVFSYIPGIGRIIACVFGWNAWLCGKVLEGITGLLSEIPFASVSMNYGFFPLFVFLSVIFASFWYYLRRKYGTEAFKIRMCAAIVAAVYLCGFAANIILRVGERYVKIYDVGSGIAIAAVSRGREIIIGSGGDEYLDYRMCVDASGLVERDIDAAVFPDTTGAMAIYGGSLIKYSDVSEVFMGISESASDDYGYEVSRQARLSGCGMTDLSENRKISAGKDLSAETFNDGQGLVWTYIISGGLSVLVCPEGGDVLMLREDWRCPNAAVVYGSTPVNASFLQPNCIVVCGEADESAYIAGLMRLKVCGNVVETSAQGNIMLTTDGASVYVKKAK